MHNLLLVGVDLVLTKYAAGYDMAVKWWRRAGDARVAVELDPAGAQNNLGYMYENGLGVPQDYAEAANWFRLSAEQGLAAAQYNLGIMYENGQGIPQDYAEAVKWWRLAAEQGHALAQYNLGAMYDAGRGVPQNYVQAHMWYSLAASRLPPGENHDNVVNNRNAVAAPMTPAQVAEAQRLASEWKPCGGRAE